MQTWYRQPPTNKTVSASRTQVIWYALDVLLFLMLVGPALAPLFLASPIWFFNKIATWIIYPLGMFICPQDQHSVHVMGGMTAVCSRCYAAIGGLLAVRLALTANPQVASPVAALTRWWRGLRMRQRAFFIVTIFALWTLDVYAEQVGWWHWGQPVLIATGPVIGLGVGFLAYGLLAALTQVRPSWD